MSCTRRGVLAGAAAVAALGATRHARAQRDAPRELARLVAANRILANEGVVDAFGHVSVRDPRNAQRFWLSRSRSPALVELDDLMEFDLEGAAIDARGRTAYGERMIHAAVYAARSDVHSVVHHHAYGVLPFTITVEPLRPVVHTASVIGAVIPVWDIRTKFGATDMLVRTIEQGRDLAATLAANTCALLRGHGAVVAGASIQRAVLTAIYLQVNANVLLQALPLGTPEALTAEEIERSAEAQFSPLALDRSWEYFCQRAGVDPG
ncbi:MAG TPA: class II aldolase/adducin family protein [Gammaproteobacteria bacterium]|nr:class II aldolase/adducin family protein [Gammaproteobacteria bacterium]